MNIIPQHHDKSFKNSLTEDAFNGVVRKGFPADLLRLYDASFAICTRPTFLQISVCRLVTDLKPSKAIAPGNTQSE